MQETQAAFARRVGLSAPRISQLVKAGLPCVDGKVDVPAALAWMSEALDPTQRLAQAKAKARPVTVPPLPRLDDEDGNEPSDEPAAGDYNTAKTAHEWLKVERAKLALERDRGNLLPAEQVRRDVFALAKAERDAWVSWPMRAAAVVAAELGVDPGDVHRLLDREVRTHLAELADLPAQ